MAVLNQRQKQMLAKLADFILPSGSGGKQIYDLVGFVEGFLSAFYKDPPTIYGGGPFSGRHPVSTDPAPVDSFSQFLPLTRYQRLAWQLRINGPAALDQELFIVLGGDIKNNYTGLAETFLRVLPIEIGYAYLFCHYTAVEGRDCSRSEPHQCKCNCGREPDLVHA